MFTLFDSKGYLSSPYTIIETYSSLERFDRMKARLLVRGRGTISLRMDDGRHDGNGYLLTILT